MIATNHLYNQEAFIDDFLPSFFMLHSTGFGGKDILNNQIPSAAFGLEMESEYLMPNTPPGPPPFRGGYWIFSLQGAGEQC